jgi:hypothetical protein
MDLSRVARREELAPQREPHWQRLAAGQFIGFRPSRKGDGGTWIARFYNSAERKNTVHSLGDFGSLPANERYGAAVKQARAWFEHVGSGGSHKPITVREACERYAENNPDAEQRFRQFVYDDPIANVLMPNLTERLVRGWRSRLESKPALVTRCKTGTPITRQRSDATINRDMVPFRAALNKALENGDALTARAWKSALKPVETADGRRNLYLDRDQRRCLLGQLPSDSAAFARGMCLLPLRPGALAVLRVMDFDARRSELVIGRDKAGGGRKILLPANTALLLKQQSHNKLPAALLFTRADGKQWIKDMWKHPIKDAVRAAGLPDGVTIYTLRHSTITDLVVGGLDLLTVAQLAGTSVLMIERHYGHLQRKHAAEALATLNL